MSVSSFRHHQPYQARTDIDVVLDHIEQLIASLLKLEIGLAVKKRMLVHALWEVAIANGNFCPRFRSIGTVHALGEKIQRDHVFQKKRLVSRLLEGEAVRSVMGDSIVCTVTVEEHKRLTQISRVRNEIDGWERYQNAGVSVRDMIDKSWKVKSHE